MSSVLGPISDLNGLFALTVKFNCTADIKIHLQDVLLMLLSFTTINKQLGKNEMTVCVIV